MGHYLNIYAVPREEPEKKILLFDMSASNDEWNLYGLFHDNASLDPYYPCEYKDGDVVKNEKYTEITVGGLREIREELDAHIADLKHRLEVKYKLAASKPEDLFFEIVEDEDYIESLRKQRTGIEFLEYIVGCCENTYNGVTKLVCQAD